MNTLSLVLRVEIWLLLGGLTVVITYQLLTGKINTSGMLTTKAGARNFSPARLQLMVITLAIAAYYLFLGLSDRHAKTLPELPNEMMLLLGGSHVAYLGGKLYAMLAEKLQLFLPTSLTGRGRQNNE